MRKQLMAIYHDGCLLRQPSILNMEASRRIGATKSGSKSSHITHIAFAAVDRVIHPLLLLRRISDLLIKNHDPNEEKEPYNGVTDCVGKSEC